MRLPFYVLPAALKLIDALFERANVVPLGSSMPSNTSKIRVIIAHSRFSPLTFASVWS
jgi:hypothetical protein